MHIAHSSHVHTLLQRSAHAWCCDRIHCCQGHLVMGEVSRANMLTFIQYLALIMESAHPQQGVNIADDADVGQAALLNLAEHCGNCFLSQEHIPYHLPEAPAWSRQCREESQGDFPVCTQKVERYLLRRSKEFLLLIASLH